MMRSVLGKGRNIDKQVSSDADTADDDSEVSSSDREEDNLESWIAWIQRVTYEVKNIAATINVKTGLWNRDAESGHGLAMLRDD